MEPGRMLAHYEVGEKIGKGGMGEVYRAKDTKLGRDVALKILPAEFAADRDRMARFEREAKVLASLHHPNIASIFGFEQTADATFLVMELVEGEDLAEVLRGGPLSADDAVDIARQIAEGLEEAHEKGIVHRDLKPANVKRTPDGKVKVLDFGLARAFAGQSAVEEAVSSAPTMTAAMTQVGTVLGTAAYMSPEQARGKEVDRRADIWAFGLILFEMLTGKQTFVGETASDTLAGILKSDPEWDALPTGLPFQVERVLRRCLEKEPRQRLRDIGEARVRLENPAAESGMFTQAVSAVDEPRRSHGLLRALPWVLVGLSVAMAGWFAQRGGGGAPEEVRHVALPSPVGVSFHLTGSYPGVPEISPDGHTIAFSGLDPQTNEVNLYLRSISDPAAVMIPDTRDAQYPFWSPDGNWVAYYRRNVGLLKAPVGGGPAQRICEAGNGKGGSWNQFGDVLLTTDYNTSIFVAPASGGEATPVTDLASDEGFNSHRHPQFLPDGRRFLYLARGTGEHESEIRLADLDGGPTVVVTTNDLMGYYASGYLIFVRGGDIVAQELDLSTGQLEGTPRMLVTNVMLMTGAAKAVFSVSHNGALTYMSGIAEQKSSLTWRDREGRVIGPVDVDDDYGTLALSPDGRFVATAITMDQSGTWDIWLMDTERKFRTRFTNDPADDLGLTWSRDGRTLYFSSDRSGSHKVYRKQVGSPARPELVYGPPDDVFVQDLAADENTMFALRRTATTEFDIIAIDLADTSNVRVVWETPRNDVNPHLSPDGKWLAWTSDQSERPQLYMAPWPDLAPVTQVSTRTGTWFHWTKGGNEIIYQEFSGQLNAVSVTYDGRDVRIGEPQPLFLVGSPSLESADWAVSGDGERFVIIDAQAAEVPAYVDLVFGWPLLLADD